MSYTITNFGAIADGQTLNTTAINHAIQDAHDSGGGTVMVPSGTFLTGTIHLKSRVTLHLEQGARILGSPNLEDYEEHSWGHHDDRLPYHLIFAEDAHDIALTGDGTIDGNGEHYKESEREHEFAFYREIPMRPSPMIELSRCQGVRVENIRITRPGGWSLHLHDCDRAFIRGITIDNSLFWPNSDGIDLTGCHDTMISDCFIHTGDDAIALKTTVDSRTCEHITVTNCVLETSCAAIRLGFESDQDFINCTFSNLTVKNCSRVIDLLTYAGGSIRNCSFTNIVGRCMSGWLFDRPIAAYTSIEEEPYKCIIPEHPNCGKIYTGGTPGTISGITITNFDVETTGRILLGCLPENEISDITLNHIRLRYPVLEDPSTIGAKVKGKSFYPDQPELRSACAALVAENVKDLRIRDFRVQWPSYPVNPDKVEILRSPNRADNPCFDDEARVLSGQEAPAFYALWLKHVSAHIDSPGLTASQEGLNAVHAEELTSLT